MPALYKIFEEGNDDISNVLGGRLRVMGGTLLNIDLVTYSNQGNKN